MGGSCAARVRSCRGDTAAALVTCRGATAVVGGVVVVVVGEIVLDGGDLWGADG